MTEVTGYGGRTCTPRNRLPRRTMGSASGWALAGVLALAAGVGLGWQLGASRRPPEASVLPGQPAPATPFRVAFEAQVDSTLGTLDSLDVALRSANAARSQQAFRNARRMYKHAESLLEFFSPTTTSAMNGPPMEDDGDAPPRPLGEPAAFQRIESGLFEDSTVAAAALAPSVTDVVMMRSTLSAFRRQTRLLRILDADVLDAARLEVARVSTLGISGVDADASGDAIREQLYAMEGVNALVQVALASETSGGQRAKWNSISNALTRAAQYLQRSSDFETFDRLTFVASYANPAAGAIATARASASSPVVSLRRAWRTGAATVFDEHAFDAWAYAREYYPEYAGDSIPAISQARIALGQRLFFDAQLSGPRTHSCATCHVPARGFSDGRARSVTLPGATHVSVRNVPTLLNAALQPNQFADARAGSLEQQIGMVLASSAEMQSSAQIAAARVNVDSGYRAQFKAAWGTHDAVSNDSISDNALVVAIAAYVRSLGSMNSRFDKAVRGDSLALSAQERRGFNLFSGKARCATCHFTPMFNGAAPPLFASSEPEIINVPSRNVTTQARIDADTGRAGIDGLAQHLFAFKVPTVRNVALTAPYMHNGVFTTLEQVVDFYNRGGGAGIGIAGTRQTLSARPLKLTDDEQGAIVAFLKSLTDSSAMLRAAAYGGHDATRSVTRAVTKAVPAVTAR